MNLLNDFFTSDVWRDISSRVWSTFCLSGLSIATNASVPQNASEQTAAIMDLMQTVSITSGILASLVSITILIRFIYWLKDKNKRK